MIRPLLIFAALYFLRRKNNQPPGTTPAPKEKEQIRMR